MNKKLTVFTAFSGYDAQLLALERLKRDYKIEYECVGWADIDRNAIKAHDALFPKLKGKNFGDISKIDWSTVQDFELLTYSSPCQDISKAGQKKRVGRRESDQIISFVGGGEMPDREASKIRDHGECGKPDILSIRGEST